MAIATNDKSKPGSEPGALNVLGDAFMEAGLDEAGLAAFLKETTGDVAEVPGEDDEESGGDEESDSALEGAEADADGEEEASEEDAESEADTEAENEGEEGPEDGEVLEGVSPEAQRKINKRIGKLVSQRKELEGRLGELEGTVREREAELAELKASTKGREEGPGALENVRSAEELAVRGERAEAVLEFTERLLRKVDRNPEAVAKALRGQGMDVAEDADAEALEDVLTRIQGKARRELTKDIPARKAFLAEEAKLDPTVKELFPWWGNAKSAEYNQAMRALEAMPGVKRLPGWKLALGVHVLGMKALGELQAKRKSGDGAKLETRNSKLETQKAKKPPVVSGGKTVAPASRDGKKERESGLLRKAVETGDARDVERLIRAGL